MMEGYGEIEQERFLDITEARTRYDIKSPRESLFASGLDQQLIESGIGKIEMSVSVDDMKTLHEGFEVCIGELPELLLQTAHPVDNRHGNEAGYERKSRKINQNTGLQTQDPKHLMHFNEYARRRWSEEMKSAPQILRDFLESGYEVHNALIRVARNQFEALEETHPGLTASHFPGVPGSTHASLSFMRLLKYDSYSVTDELSNIPVAKPHYDIGGATIQAYADAPGFWGAEKHDAPRMPYDTEEGQAYFFLGQGYKKLYRDKARFKPLYHGVDRIIPAGVTIVPERHAVILFIDAPFIDYNVTSADTLPELYRAATTSQSLAAS